MKKSILALSAMAALFLSGCCMTGFPTGGSVIGGGIISDHSGPGAFDIDNSVKPLKCGQATSKGIILFTTGDSSIKAAMDNGNIKKIHHVDFKTTNIFNIYTTVTTIVWGE
ncbi:MAG: TRL domain-containing protein [Kiritimatiellia bacterium]|nr:TRL domain-containing protein [Kiritimatiellia bacterium]